MPMLRTGVIETGETIIPASRVTTSDGGDRHKLIIIQHGISNGSSSYMNVPNECVPPFSQCLCEHTHTHTHILIQDQNNYRKNQAETDSTELTIN